MNRKELLNLIETTVSECTCPHAGDHIYKLACDQAMKAKYRRATP